MSEMLDVVTGVNIYPIKSCQAATIDGEKPQVLAVGPTGFEAYGVRDRDFVLVEAEPLADGSRLFLSQRGWNEQGRLAYRTDNVLATVATDITAGTLRVRSGRGMLELDLQEQTAGERYRYDVRIHKSSFLRDALDQGNEAAAYFTKLVGRPVRLARDGRVTERFLPAKYQHESLSNRVAAADMAPFLLVSEASLAESRRVNGIPPEQAPLNRYRGSIAISGEGIGPYREDFVRSMHVGSVVVRVVKACARCPIPNIDQTTSERTGAGLRVLRGRKGSLVPGGTLDVYFGQNLNHKHQPGQQIAAGDLVQILEESDDRNFLLA